jgi:hypothetical protein
MLSPYTYWLDIELGGTVHGEALAPLYLKRFGIGKHTRANQVRNLVGETIWESYFKFAFVRNPYARTFSVYRFLKRWRNWDGSAAMANFATFEDFLLSDMFKNNAGPDSIFLPQHTWIEDINGNSLLDFIGSVETISEALATIADRIDVKLDNTVVPVKNDSGDPDEFRKAYSEAAIEIVNQRYKRDFLLFGYSSNLNGVSEKEASLGKDETS